MTSIKCSFIRARMLPGSTWEPPVGDAISRRSLHPRGGAALCLNDCPKIIRGLESCDDLTISVFRQGAPLIGHPIATASMCRRDS